MERATSYTLEFRDTNKLTPAWLRGLAGGVKRINRCENYLRGSQIHMKPDFIWITR